MLQVQKNTIARFSNQTYSVGSFMELMGRNPEHLPGLNRMRNQHKMGLATIFEAMGNLYVEDEKSMTKVQEVMTWQYKWNLDISQIPTVGVSRDFTTALAINETGQLFVNDRMFAQGDIFALTNTQQLYAVTEPERISDNEFLVTVKLWTNNPAERLDVRYTRANSRLRFLYKANEEFSERGSSKSWYQTETHTNYLTKIRVDQSYSSDLKATQDQYFMEEADYEKAMKGGKDFKVYLFNSIEQKLFDDFQIQKNNAIVFGRSSMNPATNRSYIQNNRGEDIISGDGLIAQYEKEAYYVDYSDNNLSTNDFISAIESVCDRRGQSTGNHITCAVNRRFARAKYRALESKVFALNPNGAWFYTKDDVSFEDKVTKSKVKNARMANEITVGATLNSYIYEGNVINFVVDEALTNHYQDRGYAIFIDTGLYQTEGGAVPNVNLLTLKNRALVRSGNAGIGGMSGGESGLVSHTGDYSTQTLLGWIGCRVTNPYAATIITENV
jgi:hypothetical protein